MVSADINKLAHHRGNPKLETHFTRGGIVPKGAHNTPNFPQTFVTQFSDPDASLDSLSSHIYIIITDRYRIEYTAARYIWFSSNIIFIIDSLRLARRKTNRTRTGQIWLAETN